MGGMFSIMTFTSLRGLTLLHAIGTSIAGSFALGIFSFIVFIFSGFINYKLGMILLVGNLLGGFVGSKIAIKKGNLWVRKILLGVIAASVIKLIFF